MANWVNRPVPMTHSNERLLRTGYVILIGIESEWESLTDRIRDIDRDRVRMRVSYGQDM